MNAEEIAEALSVGSIREGQLEVQFVDVRTDDESAFVTIRLIGYDEAGHVQDIKEQELVVPRPLLGRPERVRAFAEGQREALRAVFQSPAGEVMCWMPYDLIHFGALELKRPQTSEDFRHALMQKSRLGKLRG